MLLGAILSDTVILNSPTTTERDHAVVEYLERVLALDAQAFGREMFESTADVSEVSAEELVTRDAKQYQVQSGNTICIAQVEVVGEGAARAQNRAAGGDAAGPREPRSRTSTR